MNPSEDKQRAEDKRQAWQEALAASLGHTPEAESGCPYPCPFCIGASAMKQLNPEVKAHLVSAGREFLLAARAFMDSVSDGSSGERSAKVEKIHFD